MAFVFSLKTLLRLREIQEASELQTLQTLATQVAALRAEIEKLDKAGEEEHRELCHESIRGLSGADLHLHVRREANFRERKGWLAGQLQQLEKLREEQQSRYMQARRERETISTLREQQLAEYNQEQSRREQSRLDDLFLVRYVREQNHAKRR